MILAAALGALVAVGALVGKLSGRLSDRVVDRLYYASYGLAALGATLFVVRGLFGARS
jgi:hypothetical protein